MYRLRSDRLRRLMSVPFAISIPREAPASIEEARAAVEDMNLWPLVAVGDVVTMNLKKYWREPDVAIVDGKTQRRGVNGESRASLIIDNPPASLVESSFMFIRQAIADAAKGRKITIWVNGEEDLLAIPAVLESPLGGAVMYGLYTGYLVLVPVTAEYKLLMLKLLAMME